MFSKPNEFVRPDLIFTYWIYLWFFAFVIAKYASSTSTTFVPNPSFALLVGIIENVFTVGYMLWIGAAHILWFILAVIMTKVVPFWLVFDRNQIFSRTPILDTAVLFVAYTAYLVVMGTNPVEVYLQILKSFEQNKIMTPFYFIMDWIQKHNFL